MMDKSKCKKNACDALLNQRLLGYLKDTKCVRQPSLERFYCVISCIDISGFTALSAKLTAEDFVKEINNFFDLLIAIVYSWGGDVVKFAGDSIYIIWKMSEQTVNSHEFTTKILIDAIN
jgi:class 3 adenylate cyclase